MGRPGAANVTTDLSGESAAAAHPNIYSFHDYRAFLKVHLHWLDSMHGGYSIRATSLNAGMGESNLPQVIRGTRNLTPQAQKKLFPLLKLSNQELSFLRLLCQLADAHSDQDRQAAIAGMQRFGSYKKHNQKNTVSYQYMSKWYYVVIREMTFLPDFNLDAKWIRERLHQKIPLSSIQEALDFLTQNGFIQIDKNGKVIKEVRHIDASGGIYKVALGEFHRQMFEGAIDSIRTIPRDDRLIDSNTFPVAKDDIPHIGLHP